MDPNSADPTSRPAPPGGRRRTSAKRAATPTSSTASASSTPLHSGNVTPLLEGDDDVDRDGANLGNTAMSTSDTQTTLQPVEDDASADTSADHAAAAPMSRADIDNALRGLTRDDLFTALTRAKEEMDRLDGVVSTQTLQIESLLANNHDLTARLQHSDDDVQKAQLLIQQREARVDELVYDQEKMEDEYYKKLATLERLKTRADESDRRLAEAERKANELSQASEKEREYYQNQETLLSSQNARLTKDNANLKDEVAHLRDTVDSLMEQAQQHDEQDEAQAQNERDAGNDAAAKQQNNDPAAAAQGPPPTTPSRSASRRLAAQQSPLTMRTWAMETASSSSDEAAAALQLELQQLKNTLASQAAALGEVRSSLNSERARTAELQSEKQELESMLTGNTLEQLVRGKAAGKWQQPPDSISEEDEGDEDGASATDSHETTEDEDIDDVPDTPKTPRASSSRRAKGPRTSALMRRKQSNDHLPDALENELGEGADGVETPPPANVKKLQNEIAYLRQENKNLSTYISKILNRILSMEGFERVLAHDSFDGASSLRNKRQKPRHSVLPTTSSNTAVNFAQKEEQRRSRRKSAGILGFARSSSPTPNDDSTGAGAAPTSRNAGRTASVDWRNIKLPWTSPTIEEKPSNLRPFALSATNASATTTADGGVIDDIDELERQKARTMLHSQGLTVPEHQLASPKVGGGGNAGNGPLSPGLTSSGGTFGALFSRVLGGGGGSGDISGSKTPPAKTSPLPTDEGRFASPRPDVGDDSTASAASMTTTTTSSSPLTEFVPSRPGARRPPRPSRASLNTNISTNANLGFPSSSSPLTSSPVGVGVRDNDGIGIHFPPSSSSSTSEDRSGDVSLAGDESYVLNGRGGSGSGGSGDTDQQQQGQPAPTETGWRRAFKRMSLMGGDNAASAAAAAAAAAAANPAAAKKDEQ